MNVKDIELRAKQKELTDINQQILKKLALLKMADIATMMMLFIFMVGFYVADPFHLITFITEGMSKNPAEAFVYFVLLAFAGIMSYTIAHLKREHYHHTARHNKNVWRVGFILVLFSMTGEIYNSLGSQQHSQFSKAENSGMFKTIANQQVTVNTGSGMELADAQAKLARCQENLRQGKGKDCVNSQARVTSLQQSAASAASAAADASAAISKQKTQDMKEIIEMNVHPFYKSLQEIGIPQKIAMLLLAAFVAYAFERMHLTLPEDLKDLYQKQAALNADTLQLEKSGANAANAGNSPETSGDYEITTKGKGYEVPPEKNPIGFGTPATAKLLFDYKGQKSAESDKRAFMGFIDPNKQAQLDKANFGYGSEDRKTEGARTGNLTRQNTANPSPTRGVYTGCIHGKSDTASETPGICPTCGSTFDMTRWNRRFCSDACKDAWHNKDKPERGQFKGRFSGKS